MDKAIVVRLHSSFEDMVRKDEETGTEFWMARDLQMLLGYARWENFTKVIAKAITACQNSSHESKDHFLEVTKMVDLGSSAKREVPCCCVVLQKHAKRTAVAKHAFRDGVAYPYLTRMRGRTLTRPFGPPSPRGRGVKARTLRFAPYALQPMPYAL